MIHTRSAPDTAPPTAQRRNRSRASRPLRLIAAAAGCLLVSCGMSAPAPAGAAATGDDGRRQDEARTEVAALLAEQAEAWSRGDLEAFTAVYADDAVFISPSGLTRGRDEVLARYRRRYPDRAAMGRLTLEVLEARPAPGGEVSMHGDSRPGEVHAVSVVARWTLSFPDDPGREEATGLTLLVLHRRSVGGGGWEIVQDASM